MKTRCILAAALIAVSLAMPANAQNRKMSKARVLEENARLKAKIDSLKLALDEFQNIEVVADEMNEDTRKPSALLSSYTADATDSLMTIWLMQRQLKEMNEGSYDMDSVMFTSNVPDDVLIERLEKMNSFISLPFNFTVKNYMILYTEKMPTKMGKILGLSTYYMPIIEEVLDRYQLPLELSYLAIIESAFNPIARSRAGAVGMWQFMFKTAKLYNLKVSSFVDERMDVEKSADAAARYLKDAYDLFGDWSLAISSYNCGAGNVNKAIRRAGGKRDFWSIYPYLPRETRGYVPAFVGAMYAMNYYKEYGLTPEVPQFPIITDTVEVHRNLHFQQVSDVIGIPMETLRDLNPQYIRDIVPGNEGSCLLTIPLNFASSFIENQDSLYSHKSNELIGDKIIKNGSTSGATGESITYKVKSGDYLGRIAARYHVGVEQIKRWNGLKSNNLRIGQTLVIYTNGKGPSTTASSSRNSGTSSSSTAASKPVLNANGYTTYTVKQGDSLYSIARQFPGVSADNIMQYNGIGSSIKPGMTIKIPKL